MAAISQSLEGESGCVMLDIVTDVLNYAPRQTTAVDY